nr:MAG TPA: hypothetical protein [Caudoviricetes sp.]
MEISFIPTVIAINGVQICICGLVFYTYRYSLLHRIHCSHCAILR